MICIYHNKDLGGYCSGAIVKKKYPKSKMIGYDYGQSFPWEEMVDTEDVIMIDVSLPMDEMFVLARQVKSFTWIDHHVSAIKAYWEFVAAGNGAKNFNVVLENGIAACEGGWKYLFKDEKMPTVVSMLGEYDTWRNQDKDRWENIILPSQYGMRLHCNSVETFPSNLLKDIEWDNTRNPVWDIVEEGRTILKYQKMQNEYACRYAFEAEFEGLKAICLNSGGANSQLFESVYNESKHDLMIPFFYSGSNWTFSLYTTKDEIDCSVIAKSKGGGGHKKAARFKQDYLPENFKKNDESKEG